MTNQAQGKPWDGHTPLPWGLSDTAAHGLVITGPSNGFCADWLARIDVLQPTGGANRHNAALIVHRVNKGPAADEMAEALEQAEERFQRMFEMQPDPEMHELAERDLAGILQAMARDGAKRARKALSNYRESVK